MKLVNLTTHQIRVETPRGIVEYPPSGRALKLVTMEENVCEISSGGESIPVVRKIFFEPDGGEIPPEKEGVFYIVPNQICQVMRRPDFIAPDTKVSYGARRNDDGTVMSVKRFRVYDEIR